MPDTPHLEGVTGLTPEEIELVKAHRAEKAKERADKERVTLVLKTAYEYHCFLEANINAGGVANFKSVFRYTRDDAEEMWRLIQDVRFFVKDRV